MQVVVPTFGYFGLVPRDLAEELFVSRETVVIRGKKWGQMDKQRVARNLWRDGPNESHVLVPQGLLYKPLRQGGKDIHFDLGRAASKIDWNPAEWPGLRPYQIEAVDAVLGSFGGVVEIPTAGGKSVLQVVVSCLLAQLGPVFFMTPGVTVEENFVEAWTEAREFFGRELPGRLVDYDDYRRGYELQVGDILVGSPLKLVNDGRPIEGVLSLVTDEGHHWVSDSYHEALSLLPDLSRSYAFTGTPFDGRMNEKSFRHTEYENARIIAGAGPLIFAVTPPQIREYLDLPDVLNLRFQWTDKEVGKTAKTNSWPPIQKAIRANIRRTRTIAAMCDGMAVLDRRCIVPFPTKEQALAVMESASDHRVVCWFGAGVLHRKDGTQETLNDVSEMKDRIVSGEFTILLTTSHVDESLNVPALDTCFLVEGKKLRRTKQRAGRAIRKGGKKSVVINLFDQGQDVVNSQSRYRSQELSTYYGTKAYRFDNPIDLISYMATL